MADSDYIVKMPGDPMRTLPPGSLRPDVDLVNMETKETIPLSKLRTRPSQPLVIIASSLS